jgi:hypothetical protein
MIPAADEPAEALRSGDPTRPDGVLSGTLGHELPGDSPPGDADAPPTIAAEWALWGKEAHETGYHVLRCSSGTLRARDFSEVITRYSPGEFDGLPQYTVSWIPGADSQPEYIAMGIHELAPTDAQQADGRSRRDAVGREIVFVRLFCVRYSELTYQLDDHLPGYQDLVMAASQVQFPATDSDHVTLVLPSAPSPIHTRGTTRQMADRVAALLLTGQPVCILGADDVPVTERLRFIDTVMAMLPYGLRATMSAATWAGSTSQNLKLRLFFSEAPRVGGQLTDGRSQATDSLVEWAHPEAIHVTGEAALLYQDWLEDVRAQAPALLVEQASPVRFSAAAIRRMVSSLPRDKGIPETLDDLGQSLLAADKPAISRLVQRLRRYLTSEDDPPNRIDCQRRIRAGYLLADDERLPKELKRELYGVLLKLAFGIPLTYGGYCAVEECAGVPLHAQLRMALMAADTADCLPWILAHETRPGTHSEKWLDELRQRRVAAAEPLEKMQRAVEAQALRPHHGPIVLDFALRYLWKWSENPGVVIARYGYLAWQLEYIYPSDRETRVQQLMRTLGIAFRDSLSRPDIDEIFGQPGYPPTAALEQAVLRMTDRRNHEYVRDRVAAAMLRAQGFPHRAPVIRRPALWLMRWLPWRRRGYGRAPGQPLAHTPGPSVGQPPAAARPARVRPPEPAELYNPVQSMGSAWRHPRTTYGIIMVILALCLAVYLLVQYLLLRH